MTDLVQTAVQVLLVEDDPGVAEMYRAHLTASGYGVTLAVTGEEALALALDAPPDIVYLDLGLPEMSGIAVLAQLRSQPSTAALPVVVLTNYSEPELIAQARALGAQDYLIKAHTTPSRLSESTRRWLDRS